MFVEDLNEYIKNEQLTTEQIYNADETGLFWKCLPQNSLASGDEYSIEGYKESKERITALLCANAAGTHKFYKSNKRAWVTQELFLEWFNNNFVPEVREHLQRIGLEKNCKVLLLLDNCPAHPDVNAMISDNVTVKYLPPNCTSLIQPMDQGAIRSFKCQYRKFIVQKLVDSNSRHEFVKSLNIKSALWTAATSWDSVTPRVLNKVWNNLLSQDDENDSTFSFEIQSDVLIPPGFTADAISKWMECDIDVAPFAIVSDDEIVNMVNQTEEYELESNSEESDGGNTVETPTLAQAIEASSVLLKFLENYTGTAANHNTNALSSLSYVRIVHNIVGASTSTSLRSSTAAVAAAADLSPSRSVYAAENAAPMSEAVVVSAAVSDTAGCQQTNILSALSHSSYFIGNDASTFLLLLLV
ncbi:jerky protein homolog-like [Anastrepha ludens]|uniref:jerky protein homolog-like n=1 Tax=Anastrepha ludens TaxID=28586 RepID=UPI0023B05C86|nr:jerky protein homolog-like [Anastrepha ludens]